MDTIEVIQEDGSVYIVRGNRVQPPNGQLIEASQNFNQYTLHVVGFSLFYYNYASISYYCHLKEGEGDNEAFEDQSGQYILLDATTAEQLHSLEDNPIQ